MKYLAEVICTVIATSIPITIFVVIVFFCFPNS